MNKLSVTRTALIIFVIGIIGGIYSYTQKNTSIPPQQSKESSTPQQPNNNHVQVISINPDPAQNPILLPTQQIEITFSVPVLNGGEFKHQLSPKFKYEVTTINDRKTVLIKPKSTYPLGENIRLSISPETKFDNQQKLEGDVHYNFQTIQYRGI